MLSKHNQAARHTDGFRRHDFVCHRGLEHSVLMDSRFVSKCIRTNDRFVHLNRFARDLAEHLARTVQFLGFDSCGGVVIALPRVDRHNDLFQRCVPGALADSIDGAFHLARPVFNRGKAVGDGEPEVVVAVCTDRDAIRILQAVTQGAYKQSIFDRRLIAHRIGNVDDGGSGVDDSIEHRTKIIELCSARVLGGKFDFVAQSPSAFHRFDSDVQRLSPALVELVLEMNVARSQKRMDSRTPRPLQRLPAAVDIHRHGAG